LEALNDFAKANDTVLSIDLIKLKQRYDDAMEGKQQWGQVHVKAETIFKYLDSKNFSEYSGAAEAYTQARLKHYLDIFVQGISSRDKSKKTKSRDEYMAQNIDWLVKNNEGRKIIISADNTHVTKASGKMGSFLKNWFADKYIVFGFTFNKGTYSAYGPEKYYEVHPSYVGTYEYLFSKCKFKNFLLDLRAINWIPILDTTAGFRSIGSRPQETTQFMEIILKNHFDVIAYIEKSTHTIPLTD
jgi:erythromycin esterase-like protein